MARLNRGFAAWLDDRTGLGERRRRWRNEPVPAGTGWGATPGWLAVFGLGLQAVTGVALALFYVPAADRAWDSVHFVTSQVRGGSVLRGLHYWGAGLVVAALALHLGRVAFSGAYRKPREVTWLIGVALLALVGALALTGGLLPWDQRAYWSIAAAIGTTSPTGWYALHVTLLPALVVVLTVAHLRLVRRHGAAGPATPHPGPALRYSPAIVRRIRVVVLVAAAALAALAWIGPPPLQPPADLATRGYAPRPDWYFLGLAEFASRIAAPYRVAAVLTLTGILGGCLALLPWLDRARTREPGSRLRVLAPWSAALLAAVLLTGWGLRDAPRVDPAAWSFQAIAGASLIQTSDRCVRCHRPAGVAEPIEAGHITRPQDWLAMHVGDPEVLTAGIREAPFVNQADSRAMVAALAHLRSGPPPAVDAGTLRVYALFSRYCVDCHQLNGTGGVTGPDLSHTGLKFGAATLEQRIAAAHDIRPDTVMPSFSGIIDPSDIQALAAWLAQQK